MLDYIFRVFMLFVTLITIVLAILCFATLFATFIAWDINVAINILKASFNDFIVIRMVLGCVFIFSLIFVIEDM